MEAQALATQPDENPNIAQFTLVVVMANGLHQPVEKGATVSRKIFPSFSHFPYPSNINTVTIFSDSSNHFYSRSIDMRNPLHSFLGRHGNKKRFYLAASSISILRWEELEDRYNPSNAAVLDPTFGTIFGTGGLNPGKIATHAGTGSSNIVASVVQPDGKIVSVGTSSNASNTDFLVVRYNADGSLDASFGTNGIVTADFANGNDGAEGVALQPDGKIVAVGYATEPSTGDDFAVARFLANGTLDPTFGSGGKVTTDFSGGYDSAAGVVVQPDGKLVVAGTVPGGGGEFGVARYTTSGALDLSFGSGGKVALASGGIDQAYSVALQSDGKIVVAGDDTASNTGFETVRLNPDGSLDSTFGTAGKVITEFTGNYAFGHSVAIQSDGRIVVVGIAYTGLSTGSDFAIARYTTAGVLDTTFNATGQELTDIDGRADSANAVAIQPDGKIVVGGAANTSDQYSDFAVVRYTSTGTPDSSFGSAGTGIVLTDFNGLSDGVSGLALQPDGRIVASGYESTSSAVENAALARYNPDGSPDLTFNGGAGKVTTSFIGEDFAQATAIQTDGKIVVAGYSYNPSPTYEDFALARYNPDGSLDTTFGTGGKVTTDFSDGYDQANAVLIQADGRIVAVGYTETTSFHYLFAVARYNVDGSLDTSFGTSGKLTFSVASTVDQAYAAYLEPNQEIVVAGSTYNTTTGLNSFAIAKLTTTGAFDTSFNSTGKETYTFSSTTSCVAQAVVVESDGSILVGGYNDLGAPNYTYQFAMAKFTSSGVVYATGAGTGVTNVGFGQINALAVQPNGEIIAAGYGTDNSGTRVATLIRYYSSGGIDTSFGSNGVLLDYGSTAANSLAVEADGGIVVTGAKNNDFSIQRYTATGSPDASFGSNGQVSTDFSGGSDDSFGVAVTADDRIVAAGYTETSSFTNEYFAVARYLPNGSLDPSFTGGTPGFASTAVGASGATAYGTAVQPDGKILVVGKALTSVGGTIEYAVTRYLPDGNIDTRFGTNGTAVTTVGVGNAFASSVAVQPNGMIVVGGLAYNSTQGVFGVVRFTSTGALDTTFGGGTGKALIPAGSGVTLGNDLVAPLILQPADGKILIAAGASNGSTGVDFAIARLTTTGTPDTTFGSSGGVAFVPFGSHTDIATGLAIQNNNSIVVGGYSNTGTKDNFAVARLLPTGALDTSFNGTGMQTTVVGNSYDDANAVAIQSNGMIVLAGVTDTNTVYGLIGSVALVRYNSNGSIDPNFGNSGKVTVSLGNPAASSFANALVVQADGKLVIGGGAVVSGQTASRAVVARFTTTGSLDTSFGGDGTWFGGGSSDTINGLALQPDGRIIASGVTAVGASTGFSVYRFLPNSSTVAVDSSGNLTLTDSTGGNNHYVIRSSGSAVQITDTTGIPIYAGSGATASAGYALDSIVVPASSFTGQIKINEGAGNNSILIDFSKGNPIPAAGVVVTSSNATDLITAVPGSTPFSSSSINYSPQSGTVATGYNGLLTFNGSSTVSFAGIGRVSVGASNSDSIATTNLGDTVGIRQLGTSVVVGPLSQSPMALTFPPTSLDLRDSSGLTIAGGSGNDTFDLSGLGSDFTGPVVIGGGGGTNAITVEDGATLTANANQSASLVLQPSTTGSIAGGALTVAAPATFTSVASGTGSTIALTGGGLTEGSDNSSTTLAGTINGTGGFAKVGNGTLTLTGSNSYAGGTTVSFGTLAVNSDLALGLVGTSVSVSAPGRLTYTAGLTPSSRNYLLNGNGALQVNSGVTLNLSNAGIYGGFLQGPGTFATTAVGSTTFNATSLLSSAVIQSAGMDNFTDITNAGSVVLATGESASLDGFTNQSSALLTVNGNDSFVDFLSYGQIAVNGTFTNVGSTSLSLGGGSTTTVNAGGFIHIGSGGAHLTSGLITNNGSFGDTGTLMVDYGAKYVGHGILGTYITQNGGIYAPGNSPGPGTATTMPINSGGIMSFQIANATGAAGAGSGWTLATVENTVFGNGQIAYTATSATPYTIAITSRLNASPYDAPGAAANFDPTQSYSWHFVDGSTASVSGTFSPSLFTVDASGFANSFNGTFSVQTPDNGHDLYLTYTPSGPMVTTAPSINGGVGVQRSLVTSLTVAFNEPVTISPGAFTLTRQSDGSSIASGTGGQITVANPTGDHETFVLTFTGAGSLVQSGSLADGVYVLNIDHLLVTGGTSGTGPTLAADYNSPTSGSGRIYRLFGDFNGDGSVNGADFAAFSAAYNAGPNDPNYEPYFDFTDSNQGINSADFTQFSDRYGTSL